MSRREEVLEAGDDHHVVSEEQLGEGLTKWATETGGVLRIC